VRVPQKRWREMVVDEFGFYELADSDKKGLM